MKNIEVIGMPMKYGCMVKGADLAYEYIKDSLEKVLHTTCNNVIDVSFKNPEMHKNDKKLKYLEPVMEINKRLYTKTYKSLEKNNIPLVVGGDHSQAIGSIKASLDYYKGDVSVIYVDKHADIHNEKTTPSGNIHGMPLSVCIGRCDHRFDIGSYNLKPENLYFIGLSNYEKEEMDYIKESNIFHLMDHEVNEENIGTIVNNIKSKLKTKNVHISFDLDSIKPEDFPAVNVAVESTYQDETGMSYNTAKKVLELLLKELNVCSMDFVEYNPTLDENKKCIQKIEELLKVIRENL